MKSIDINTHPDVASLVEQVAASQQPLALQRDGEDVAILMPATPTGLQPQGLTEDDALWSVAGIGSSTGPGDVSTNKHTYVATTTYVESHPPQQNP